MLHLMSVMLDSSYGHWWQHDLFSWRTQKTFSRIWPLTKTRWIPHTLTFMNCQGIPWMGVPMWELPNLWFCECPGILQPRLSAWEFTNLWSLWMTGKFSGQGFPTQSLLCKKKKHVGFHVKCLLCCPVWTKIGIAQQFLLKLPNIKQNEKPFSSSCMHMDRQSNCKRCSTRMKMCLKKDSLFGSVGFWHRHWGFPSYSWGQWWRGLQDFGWSCLSDPGLAVLKGVTPVVYNSCIQKVPSPVPFEWWHHHGVLLFMIIALLTVTSTCRL